MENLRGPGADERFCVLLTHGSVGPHQLGTSLTHATNNNAKRPLTILFNTGAFQNRQRDIGC
jgi:hypothetical protein